MEPASPARLYASVASALLVVLGIVGFFYDASFTSLDDLQPALGAIDVNAWVNLFYVLTGAVGVLLAGVASRQYALAVGVLYTVLGLAAAAGTPSGKPRRRSEPRAKTVRQRA